MHFGDGKLVVWAARQLTLAGENGICQPGEVFDGADSELGTGPLRFGHASSVRPHPVGRLGQCAVQVVQCRAPRVERHVIEHGVCLHFKVHCIVREKD